jgi:hypothetical protein
MTDIEAYVEYFRTIAREHPEINGFFMMDINEPLDALRTTIKYPALILTSLSGSFQASNLDNIIDVVSGGFLVIDHLQQVDNFPSETTLLSKTKRIGVDIISRMLNDYLRCEPLAIKAIPEFDIGTVSYEMIGPMFDNDFGIIFNYRFHDFQNS